MQTHRGWIALDIDGTITDATHRVPKQVIDYLHGLHAMGWKIVFITGRTFSFSYPVLQNFDFEFYLAVQNGADIIAMPEKKCISRHYLDGKIITALDELYVGKEKDYLLYSGFETGDFCYYCPTRISEFLKTHLDMMQTLSPEPWKPMEEFVFSSKAQFPLAKCLGTEQMMEVINAKLKTIPFVSATKIKDPLADEIYLNLITSTYATKGKALRSIEKLTGHLGPIIVAGDDLNDISMLNEADIKIVMSSAPLSMHPMADILARPGTEHGIIDALKKATGMGSSTGS